VVTSGKKQLPKHFFFNRFTFLFIDHILDIKCIHFWKFSVYWATCKHAFARISVIRENTPRERPVYRTGGWDLAFTVEPAGGVTSTRVKQISWFTSIRICARSWQESQSAIKIGPPSSAAATMAAAAGRVVTPLRRRKSRWITPLSGSNFDRPAVGRLLNAF